MAEPLISISIPSYERLEFFDRLLESIKIQTFKNFEVIVTDDSKTENVKNYIQNYKADFPLYYYKNIPSLGTAKNMFEGRRYARSQWIKIIHDDDFFATENAIEEYAKAISKGARYIFSGYNEYIENQKKSINKTISEAKFNELSKEPSILFANNLIGPPSVFMFHTSVEDVFDISLKWFTDMEYYYRILGKEKAYYIAQPIVNVSSNDTQVTSYTRTNPSVIIPEALYLLNKHGNKIASNLIAYDSWWRVFRNMGITDIDEIQKYNRGDNIPAFVKKMLNHQRAIPRKMIKNGFLSKACMGVSFILNKIGGMNV